MSIIQDALKKIDRPPPRERSSASPSQPPAAVSTRQSQAAAVSVAVPPATRQGSRFLPLAVLAGTIIAVGVALILLAFFRAPAGSAGLQAQQPAPAEADAVPSPPSSHQETIYRTVEQQPAGEEPAPKALPVEPPPPEIPVVRAAPPDLALDGIMYLESGPRAIVNNAIVAEGDMVSGATVIAINKKSVILTYNNVEITLNLK